MKIQAHRIDKLAEKASFMTNELFEYLLDEIDAMYCNQDGVEFFVWFEKEDLDELEKLLEKYRTGEYEGEEDDEDYDEDEEDEDDYDEEEDDDDEEEFDEDEEMDFTEKDFREAEAIIKRIKQDLDKDGSVIYIFQ